MESGVQTISCICPDFARLEVFLKVAVDQISIDCLDAIAMFLPSGEKASALMNAVPDLSVCFSSPSGMERICICPPSWPTASNEPSLLKSREDAFLSFDSSDCILDCLMASQRMTAPVLLMPARMVPSLLKSTARNCWASLKLTFSCPPHPRIREKDSITAKTKNLVSIDRPITANIIKSF